MFFLLEPEPERERCLWRSCRAICSKSCSIWCSAKRLSSISLHVTFRNFGFGCNICLRTGCDSCARRDRGTWTRESETGSRDIVTCIALEGLPKVVIYRGRYRGGEGGRRRERNVESRWLLQYWGESKFLTTFARELLSHFDHRLSARCGIPVASIFTSRSHASPPYANTPGSRSSCSSQIVLSSLFSSLTSYAFSMSFLFISRDLMRFYASIIAHRHVDSQRPQPVLRLANILESSDAIKSSGFSGLE